MAISILSAGLPFSLSQDLLSSPMDNAIKVSILLALALAVSLVLKRTSAAMRHLVWCAALAASLVMPLLSLCLPHLRVLPIRIEASAPLPTAPTPIQSRRVGLPQTDVEELKAFTPQFPAEPQPDSVRASNSEPGKVSPTSAVSTIRFEPIDVLIVWGIGTGLMVFRLLRGSWRLRRLRGQVTAIHDGPIIQIIDAVANELGVRTPVAFIGVRGTMPMVWGIIRGHILLPAEAEEWNANQLRAVILHELAHLRRRDPLTQFIGQLARAMYWFNPLAWYALHRLKIEQERACDDYVLRGGIRASEYAGHVLEVATDLSPIVCASAALAMAEPARIERRLNTILDAKCNRRSLSTRGVTAIILSTVVIAICLSVLQSAKAQSGNWIDGNVTDQFGKPIAGATVELVKRNLAPSPSTDLVESAILGTTTSAADGTFRLNGDLSASGDGVGYFIRGVSYGRVSVGLQVHPQASKGHQYWDSARRTAAERPWLFLVPVRSVHGIVVDEKGAPLGGAKISAAEFRDPVKTGADGRFEIADLPDMRGLLMRDPTVLEFSHPDYAGLPLRLGDEPSLPELQADGSWRIEMVPLPVTISGTIGDEKTKAPIANASVLVQYPIGRPASIGTRYATGSATISADGNGRYSARVPPGEILLTPIIDDPEGHRFRRAGSEVRKTVSGDHEEQDLTIRKEQIVSGEIRGASPADFAHLRVDMPPANRRDPPSRGKATFVRKDGSFSMEGVLPGSYELHVVQTFGEEHNISRLVVGHQHVEVLQGNDTKGIEIAIEPGPALDDRPVLHGRVLNPDGSPAILASIGVELAIGVMRRTFTDFDGRFSLADATLTTALSLNSTDAAAKFVAVVDIPAPVNPAIPVEIKLSPSAKITGRVYDENNHAMTNVKVSLAAFASTSNPNGGSGILQRDVASTQTDEDGRYTLSGFVISDGQKNLGVSVAPEPVPGTARGLNKYDVGELKSGEELTGVNFRVIHSARRIEVKPERD